MKEQLISTITTMITTNFVSYMEYDVNPSRFGRFFSLAALNDMTLTELTMFHTELIKVIPAHE